MSAGVNQSGFARGDTEDEKGPQSRKNNNSGNMSDETNENESNGDSVNNSVGDSVPNAKTGGASGDAEGARANNGNTNVTKTGAEEPQTMSLSANKTSATLEDLEKLKKEYAVRKSQLSLIKTQFNDKKQESMALEKQMQKRREVWQKQRQRIIEKYFAQLPNQVSKHHDLTKQLNKKKNQNMCIKTSLDISNNTLQNELNKLTRVYEDQRSIAEQTQSHNRQLHLRMDELRKELKELESELNSEHSKVIAEPKAPEAGANAVFSEYPPESTVIENLLQAQVEFYFSDYNLKRDKRLLMEVDRPPQKGYLPIDHVMKLARIRQLCSESHILIAALERSKILSLKKVKIEKNDNSGNHKDYNKLKLTEKGNDSSEYKDDGSDVENEEDEMKEMKEFKDTREDSKNGNIRYQYWVGRDSFERPREKEFPFRRTVFIFGIPLNCDTDSFLNDMLKPFGQITKIQSDEGQDSLDRKIGKKFLQKSRVYKLTVASNNGSNNGNNNVNNNGSNSNESTNVNSNEDDNSNGNGDSVNTDASRIGMDFYTEYKSADSQVNTNSIPCHRCKKSKPVSEGFYRSIDNSLIYCSQCAAILAEKQLSDSYKIKDSSKKDAFLGKTEILAKYHSKFEDESNGYNMGTALVVFASQRQASKCAYVRTRIAYHGAFATHFHHYSKIKKDIVSSNDPDSVEIKDEMEAGEYDDSQTVITNNTQIGDSMNDIHSNDMSHMNNNSINNNNNNNANSNVNNGSNISHSKRRSNRKKQKKNWKTNRQNNKSMNGGNNNNNGMDNNDESSQHFTPYMAPNNNNFSQNGQFMIARPSYEQQHQMQEAQSQMSQGKYQHGAQGGESPNKSKPKKDASISRQKSAPASIK